MRRLVTFVVVLAFVMAGFYGAWPAWTGVQIRNAIEANDPVALAQKIDFDSVRTRAKPIVAEQVQRSLDQLQKQAGPLGAAIASQLQGSLGDRLTNAAIDAALTPENVIRLAHQGKDFGRILKDIARERAEKGTTHGAPDAPATPAPSVPASGGERSSPQAPPPHKLTRENIKGYRITGPLSLEIGVAQDPAAAAPDIIAELAFTGGDWRVVGIMPRL